MSKGSVYPFESNNNPVTSCIFGRKSAACSAGNLLINLLVSDSITDTKKTSSEAWDSATKDSSNKDSVKQEAAEQEIKQDVTNPPL